MEKKQKAATESGILLVIVAGILIALNALSALGGYKRIDTTKNERYTLSKGSANLLRNMKQNMQVDAYVTKGLPKLDAFVRDLRDLLQEYKTASGGKFDYQIIEAKDEDSKKAAKEAGLVEQPFGEASDTEERAAVAMGFMGLVLKYGPEKDAIKYLPPDSANMGLEFWLTNKIRELRDKADDMKHKIGVVTGVDELKLSDTNLVPSNQGKFSFQSIVTQNFPFYSFVDVNLSGDAEIDSTLDGLLITQPGRDLTEKELRRIDQFLLKGKSVAIFASAVNTKAGDASMNATLSTRGLDKLLSGYGIDMNKDAILDFGRSMRVLVPTQMGVAQVRIPQILKVQDDSRFTGDEQLLDTSFAAFFRMQDIAVPLASSLTLKKEKQPDAKLKGIVRTTPVTARLTGDTADLKFLQNWGPTLKKVEKVQQTIGASLEGTIKTAFPEGDKQGIETPAQSAQPARLFVLASSQFLTNPFARAGNGPDMGGQMGMMMPPTGDETLLQIAGPYAQQELTQAILVLKNTLDWLSGDTDLLAVSAKILQEPGLVYGDVTKPSFDPNETEDQLRKKDLELKQARKATQVKVEWTLILGVPLLFALYGIFRWRSRLNARAHVSLA
jgi:ABC-type uncharacterized transport system involved in gliding motility auxiliary subunit